MGDVLIGKGGEINFTGFENGQSVVFNIHFWTLKEAIIQTDTTKFVDSATYPVGVHQTFSAAVTGQFTDDSNFPWLAKNANDNPADKIARGTRCTFRFDVGPFHYFHGQMVVSENDYNRTNVNSELTLTFNGYGHLYFQRP